MADLDFHPSKAEQQNVGRTTENTLSNAQNEINSTRGTVPNSSKAEIASQTEAMTKGDKPILPAFDMSRFGDENQSKQSSVSSTSDAKNSDSRKDSNQVKDDSASSSNTPSNTDAVTATNKNLDNTTKSSTGKNTDAVTTTNNGSDDPTKSSPGLTNLDATEKFDGAKNNKDSSTDAKTGPSSPEANSNKSGSADAKNEPTSATPNTSSQGSSDGRRPASDTKPVDGSDNVTIAPPAAGNASAAGSQTTSRP